MVCVITSAEVPTSCRRRMPTTVIMTIRVSSKAKPKLRRVLILRFVIFICVFQRYGRVKGEAARRTLKLMD
ncbi:hypothetical protein D3C81_1930660 [compost metagenome]